MAYLGKNNRISGSLGDLVFRQVNGKTIVQRKPEKNTVKQTQPTKKAAADFGRASTTARKIRIGLQTYSRGFADAKSFCRLRTRIQLAARTNNPAPVGERKLWEGTPALLEGFEYNLHSPYDRYCQVQLSTIAIIDQKLEFTVESFFPKQALTWPVNAEKAKLCFWMAVHREEDDLSVQEELFQIELTPSNEPITQTSFTSESFTSSDWVFVWGGILYFENNQVLGWGCINDKKLQPLRLLKVFSPT